MSGVDVSCSRCINYVYFDLQRAATWNGHRALSFQLAETITANYSLHDVVNVQQSAGLKPHSVKATMGLIALTLYRRSTSVLYKDPERTAL
jgi:hypothetical protein